MSAMPARAPQITRPVKPQPVAKKSQHKRTVKQFKQVISPTLEVIHDAVPEGRANTKVFSFIVLGLVSLGLLGLLLVNTFTAKASFEKRQLQRQVAQLTAQEQQLQRQVALKESPGQLLIVAQKMGMVPAATPAFLRLSDHKILGVPQPAEAGK
ncbi:MAG: hypothetical protein EBS36_03245 [Actinobacteria bacterium]|nr:hypothetical protein [Actinomycetota bacterium]NBY15624.1 hypothetical protein [Actinomycetota bacterium]